MIALKATKYKILEFCLDFICDSIYNKLSSNMATLLVGQLRPGMYFKKLEIAHFWWTEVTIKSISGLKNSMVGQYCDVVVSYKHSHYDTSSYVKDDKENASLPIRVDTLMTVHFK